MFNFGRGYYEEQFCEIILNLDQWLRRKYCSKIFLIDSLVDFFSVEWNHLCNFGRGCYEEQFCEII